MTTRPRLPHVALSLPAPCQEPLARRARPRRCAPRSLTGSRCRLCRCFAPWSARACTSTPERLSALADGLGAEIDDLARRIRTLAGDETFNIASPMQLSHILFDVMGLPTRGLKKTAPRLLLHQRPRARGARPRQRVCPARPRVPREDQDQEHLPRYAGRASPRGTAACTPLTTRPSRRRAASPFVQPQPAEHSPRALRSATRSRPLSQLRRAASLWRSTTARSS